MADAALTYAAETTYGTGVAATRELPFRSSSMDAVPTRLDDPGNVSGATLIQASQLALGRWAVSGSIEYSLYKSDQALFWYHALGSNVDAGAGPYTHTITPSGDLTGLGITIQEQVPDNGPTPATVPYTYTGCKIQRLGINCSPDDMTLSLDLIGQDKKDASDGGVFVTQTGALPAGLTRFEPDDFAFTMDPDDLSGESARCVRSFTLDINNTGLITDRYCLGTSIVKEPLLTQMGVGREITGTIEMEWDSDVHLDWERYIAQTITDCTLTIDDGTSSIVATMDIETQSGAKPQLSSTGLIYMTLGFRCVGTGGDDSTGFSVVITDPDAAP